MVRRVYENAAAGDYRAVVVTDDSRIEEHVKGFGGLVARVDDDVASGTERVYLAWKRHYGNEKVDLVLNFQGDEPLLIFPHIKKMVDAHLNSKFDIMTIVKKRTDLEGMGNPNLVKAVFVEHNGRCPYFSRAGVPFPREQTAHPVWFQHLGIYSYRPAVLDAFCKTPEGPLEKIERLEQLRALEMGMTIGAVCVEGEFASVDTPEDVLIVEKKLRH